MSKTTYHALVVALCIALAVFIALSILANYGMHR